MNNNTFTNLIDEDLNLINGGKVTAKQTLSFVGGVFACVAFGPVGGIVYASALYLSDYIDDDYN